MKRVTVNLDPPYVILDNDAHTSSRTCSNNQLRAILSYLGCDNWPMRDCVVRADLTAPLRKRINEILNSKEESVAA